MSNDVPTTSATPLSMAAVTALVIGVIAIILEVFTIPGLKPLALIAGLAAVIVGAAAAVNARRKGLSGAWIAYLGTALGIVALVMLAIWFWS